MSSGRRRSAVVAQIERLIESAVDSGLCPHPSCGWRSNAASQRDRRKSALKHTRTATVHESHFVSCQARSFLCPVCWLMLEEGEFDESSLRELYPRLLGQELPDEDSLGRLLADAGLPGSDEEYPQAREESDESDDEPGETLDVCPHVDCEWRPKSGRAASAKILRHSQSLAQHRYHLNQQHDSCPTCIELIAQGKWDAPTVAAPEVLREPSPDPWDNSRERLREFRLHSLAKRPRAVYQLDPLPSDLVLNNPDRKKQKGIHGKPLPTTQDPQEGDVPMEIAETTTTTTTTATTGGGGAKDKPKITPVMAARAQSPTFEYTGYHDNRATESTLVQEMGLLRRDVVRTMADTTRAKLAGIRSLALSVDHLNRELFALKSSINWAILKPPAPDRIPQEGSVDLGSDPESLPPPVSTTTTATTTTTTTTTTTDAEPTTGEAAVPTTATTAEVAPPTVGETATETETAVPTALTTEGEPPAIAMPPPKNIFWKTFTNQLLHGIASSLQTPRHPTTAS